MAGCGHGCVMAVAYARYSHADASAAQGPKVCRLFAGGKWIRNFGPWGRQVLRRNPNSFREIDKARRLGTVAILARNRKFESIPLQRGVRCEPVSGGNSPSYLEKPRFSASVRAGTSGALGRDAPDAATSGRRAVISLSGHIPVPHRR